MILALITVSGLTFPVLEPDPIASMQAQTEKFIEQHKADGAALEEFLENPTPVEGIEKASVGKTHRYDPTFTHEGQTINPLDEISIPGALLLFDSTDPEQLAWAKKFPEKDFIWILVKGSPLALSSQENREVYFDQWGLFTERFGIKNVPAKVSQQGNRLLVEEVSL